jgi:DNA-binding transcriptional LysR family regulator
MDLQQLRVFREAARVGGFTKASEELRLSQSTISLHIKRLEDELGCPLFLRTRKRVFLNEAGDLLLQYVDRIFQEVKNAEMAVRELSKQQRGIIRLGSGPTTLVYLLPRILSAYQRKHPEIELIVTTNSSELLAQGVNQQKLDMAVVMLPVQPSLAIEVIPLIREELVCVVASSNPLAERDFIEAQELADLPMIAFLRGSAMQNMLDDHFAALNVTPRIRMEMENIEAIKALVRAGLGAAILPACSVAGSHGAMLHAFRIKGYTMERDLALALPKAAIQPRPIQKFAAQLFKALSSKSIQEMRAVLDVERTAALHASAHLPLSTG